MTTVAAVEVAPLARMVREAPQPDDGQHPAYRALAHAVRSLILDGRICPRTRIPAERELATALGMSRTTVSAAYDLLRREEFLESRRGSGTWAVLPAPGAVAPIDLSRAILGPTDGFLAETAARVLTEAGAGSEIAAHLADPGRHPAGLPDLRAAVAERYSRRGWPTAPEQIVVTGGARAGLALVTGLVCGHEDRVLVENPTHPEALAVFRSSGLRPVPVPISADAATLAAHFLQAVPALAYLGAGYQTPTGIVLPTEQRLAAAEAARRAGSWLVADETAIELGLDGEVPEPFGLGVSRAAAERLIAVGSPAETFGAGLRVGWIRASARVAAGLARRQTGLGLGVSVLDQIVAVEALCRGEDAVAVAERRVALRARRAALEAALARWLPQWSWRRPAGGLGLWVDLGRPSAAALARRAADVGVRIADGSRFGVDPGTFDERVYLPYTLPAGVLAEAVRRLSAVWQGSDLAAFVPERDRWVV